MGSKKSQHYTQQLREWNKEANELNFGKTGKPFVGNIVTNNPKEEYHQISGAIATRASTLHPYIGVDSWIRVCPNIGTSVLMNSRDDEANIALLTYDTGISESRFDKYNLYQSLYRPLEEGEIEIISTGKSFTWWGNNSFVFGSGLVSSILDKEDLTYTNRASTFYNLLHTNVDNNSELSRFGVIRRNKKLIQEEDKFIKEFAIIFDDIQFILGNVYSDDGEVVQVDDKDLLFSRIIKDSKYQIDKEGNLTTVFKKKTCTSDVFYEKCKKYRLSGEDLSYKGNSSFKGTNLNIENQNLTITSTNVKIQSSNIILGNGTDPIVLGNQLVIALSSLVSILTSGVTIGESSVKIALTSWLTTYGTTLAPYLSLTQKTSL